MTDSLDKSSTPRERARGCISLPTIIIAIAWTVGGIITILLQTNSELRCPMSSYPYTPDGGRAIEIWESEEFEGVTYSRKKDAYLARLDVGPGGNAWIFNPPIATAVFEVLAQNISDPVYGTGAYIVFRADGSGGYALSIHPDGHFEVKRYSSTSSEWAEISSGRYESLESSNNEDNQAKHVVIIMEENRFSILLNGTQLTTFSDDKHPYGRVGLGVFSATAEKAEIEFSNPEIMHICDWDPRFGMTEALIKGLKKLGLFTLIFAVVVLIGRMVLSRLRQVNISKKIDRKILRRWIIRIAILISILCILFGLFYSESTGDCVSPVAINSWIDLNGSLTRDPSEQPLPGVEYYQPSPPSYLGKTDSEGNAIWDRLTGCPGDYGGQVEVITPEGYVPTTPTLCIAYSFADVCTFGFIPAELGG